MLNFYSTYGQIIAHAPTLIVNNTLQEVFDLFQGYHYKMIVVFHTGSQ